MERDFNCSLNLQKNLYDVTDKSHAGEAMNRKEAISVLREVLEKCNGELSASSVSLSSIDPSNYQLTINCTLDNSLRKCVNTIAERHRLKIREDLGKFTIHS
jgi:hypothetical protein